jgi:hypothetical protein
MLKFRQTNKFLQKRYNFEKLSHTEIEGWKILITNKEF